MTASGKTFPIQSQQQENCAMTTNSRSTLETRPSRCQAHGLVEGTRKMPRLIFPFIVTGAMRLVAKTRPFRCPRCGANTTRA
jgi:hypothetical protein